MNNFIYLVRHGETEWNNKNIMHGQIDVPLNELGIKQAKLLGQELKDVHFDVCFCSTLGRAKQTASEILKYHDDVPIIYDDRLMELYKGTLEGTHNSSEAILKNEQLEILQKYDIESKAHFFTRVNSLTEEILTNYADKDVLIVSHSGTVKMIMFYLNPPEETINEAYYKVHVKNCSVQRFDNIKSNQQAKLVNYAVNQDDWPYIAEFKVGVNVKQ